MEELFTGELHVLQQLNKYEFAFEADILRNGLVQGGRWDFRNLDQYYRTFAGQPVLVAYTHNGRKVGDGHNAKELRDPKTGDPYRSFTASTAERIVGMISEDESDLTIVEMDGHKWLRVKGRIWAEYAHELIAHLELTGSMSVSVEVMVEEQREEDGIEIFEVWQALGLTILGDDVAPAVPGANIRAIAALQDEFKEMKLRVASLVKEENEDPKPQNNSDKKGMNRTMRLSKQQLREQQAKFGDKKVLAAEQREDGAVDFCLMGNGGTTYVCRLSSIDEAFDAEKYPERIKRVNAQVHFCAEDGEDMCVDASDMTECATEGSSECAAELEKCKAELEKCQSELATMQANEDARRLSAAKKTATDTLEAFNANREDKVDVKVLESINAAIDAGNYTKLEDANHVWCGDQRIAMEVKALCADAVMEIDKKCAEKRNEPKPMTWGSIKQASAAPGTIGELFAAKNH